MISNTKIKKNKNKYDFLIIIEEYVGANKNALVDHKKDKNIKKHKKDIRT